MEIELREWQPSDAEKLADIVTHTNHKYLRTQLTEDFSIEDAAKYIDFAINEGKGLFRAIEYNGKVVGSISVEVGSDEVTKIDGRISYFLRSTYEGNGIMTMAVKIMVKEAFKKLDIARISAYVASPNIGSIKVLENNMFKCEGVMRKASMIDNEFTDVAIFSLLKEEC